ncbi:MAG TPA: hydroxysqualene dehydroxylase HpnE [Caulobacteraceae bacterium]|nr:hydroxysqualene dehydroxylase HpnE [Caulobacteraceae bacterium]
MKAHVIGAGLAGLSAAVEMASAGVAVELSEAAGQAGGRCRSYYDPQVEAVIDNGNHLVMSGNAAVARYLALIGAAEDALAGPDDAVFDFLDLADGARWRLRPNAGPVPWWVFAGARRTPGTKAADHLALGGLLLAASGRTVGEAVPTDTVLWRRLIDPVMRAALNTEPARGSARLAAAIVRETLAKGGRASRPRIARHSLAATFVDPAIATLERLGGAVRLGRRLRAIAFAGGRAVRLRFADGDVEIGEADRVVIATPPWVATELLPGVSAPDAFNAIVNGHYMRRPPAGAPALLCLIGGTVEWIFTFEDRISVTVSAADRLVDLSREALAARLWADVARALDLSADLPPWQIVKERRATFSATVEQDQLRPATRTRWTNVALAGDWVQTGLPATIEGALRSGVAAARLAMAGARG